MSATDADCLAVERAFVARWHAWAKAPDGDVGREIFHPDAILRSPAFYGPKNHEGYAQLIATTALKVFEGFHYTGEWIKPGGVILEFEAHVGDQKLKGIDRFVLDANGRVLELEVLIRPLNALAEVANRMREHLTRGA